MIRSHGTKSHMLVSKLLSGTSKTKAGQGGLVRVALFWKSHFVTCSPACVILYHVTGSCKGTIHFISTSWYTLIASSISFNLTWMFDRRKELCSTLFKKN